MPTVWRYRGYRFFFFSNERRERPHIHVEKGGRYAKFWLRPVALVRSEGLSAHELTRVRKIVERNRAKLEDAWDEFFKGKSSG
ncbi:MAG: DUF4160 domain-containing protein [Planctomycetota bacterium]|nr:MAG: DUF4160 domain-containing protein [Planctomycetota bacterium]